MVTNRLHIHAEAGEWYWIDKIPQPPTDVLQTADNPRPPPCRAAPAAHDRRGARCADHPPPHAVESSVRCGRSRQASPQQGLDKVFDGNWQGDAGQFLLRWYSHSIHHQRLLLATREGIVLAAPPRRVSVGREKHLQIVARLPAAEAALVDPFSGEFETRMLLIRFRDGSWLRVDTEELRSDLPMHVLRQPLPDS